MTPTATYIAEENCLQELPQVKKPLKKDYTGHLKGDYKEAAKRYTDHLYSLRKIPCDPSCKGLWADGDKLEVGKDYEVKMDCKYAVSCFVEETCNCVFTAFPLVPVKSENAIWQRLLTYFKDGFADFKTDEELIDDLKKYFILTPKQ